MLENELVRHYHHVLPDFENRWRAICDNPQVIEEMGKANGWSEDVGNLYKAFMLSAGDAAMLALAFERLEMTANLPKILNDRSVQEALVEIEKKRHKYHYEDPSTRSAPIVGILTVITNSLTKYRQVLARMDKVDARQLERLDSIGTDMYFLVQRVTAESSLEEHDL